MTIIQITLTETQAEKIKQCMDAVLKSLEMLDFTKSKFNYLYEKITTYSFQDKENLCYVAILNLEEYSDLFDTIFCLFETSALDSPEETLALYCLNVLTSTKITVI